MKTYGVIMAGGGGTRFWPLSTKAEPKQFLNLSGKDILVNETIDRQQDLMDQKDIFIVTNETQAHSRQNCGRSYSGRACGAQYSSVYRLCGNGNSA